MAFSDLCDSIIFCQFSQQCPDRSLQNKQCSVARDSWGLLLLPGVCPWILTLVLHHPSPSLCDWTGSSAATGKVLIQGDTWPHYCWWHFSLCLQDVNSNNDKITLFFFQLSSNIICFRKKEKQQKSVMEQNQLVSGRICPNLFLQVSRPGIVEEIGIYSSKY